MAWQTPKTNWQAGDVPSKDDFNRIEANTQELQDVKAEKADLTSHTGASSPHSGHATVTALNTHTGATSAHNATSAATANRIMMRDAYGRAKVAKPVAGDDVARKDTVDVVQSNLDAHKAENSSTTAKGHVQLNNTVTSTSTTQAATANAVKTVNDALTSHKAENASTTTKGHVQLSSSTSSTSTSLAATASAVKTVNDALTSHKTAAAPHSGHETPAGAQAKASAAAGMVASELTAHKADGASHAKTARFVIGTSTSGWTEKDCDYLCDGTADQTEINAAITALPATGGEVVILDGTYNITAKIDVTKNNVIIRGNGNATILKRMFNSSVKEGVITLTGRSGCKIADLQVDGNKTSYSNNNNYGIFLSSSSNNTVTGNTCNNNSTGISLSSSSNNNTVTSNTCNNNNNTGIYLSDSSNNTVTGNTCNNNYYGISLSSSSNNTVTGNTCNNNSDYGIYLYSSSNNNTVTGNTCNNNNYGIHLYSSSSDNTVTGNTCNNNNYGIYLYSSSNNTVTGNTCIRGTGQSSDYTSSQYTIRLRGTGNNYNLISNNNCMGKAVTNEGGTGNTLVNNKFDAS